MMASQNSTKYIKKKELIPVLLKLFQKLKRMEHSQMDSMRTPLP